MVIVIANQNSTDIIRNTALEKEEFLQQSIKDHPELIPIYEFDNRKLMILTKEFPVSSGFIDALGTDSEGNIYIIETKLIKNADKRQVIAQVLDYASSLWNYMRIPEGYEDFSNKIDIWADEIRKFFNLDNDILLSRIKEKVREGNYKLVVVMDFFDEHFKNMVSYINRFGSFDLYGVEIEYYKKGDMQIFVPKIIGLETAKAKETKKEITLPSPDELISSLTKQSSEIYKRLLEKNVKIDFGRGIFPKIIYKDSKIALFYLYPQGNGTDKIQFWWKPLKEANKSLADTYTQDLRKISVWKLSDEGMPSVFIDKNFTEEHIKLFVDALFRVISSFG